MGPARSGRHRVVASSGGNLLAPYGLALVIDAGHDAIRAKFAGTLAMLPDIAYESLRLRWGDEFLVHELSASGTPTMAPEGGAIHFDMVDVIEFRDGLLWTKNTYVDAAPIAARLQARSASVHPG